MLDIPRPSKYPEQMVKTKNITNNTRIWKEQTEGLVLCGI